MWESKEKHPTPILLVRYAILVFRGGILLCRCGILGLAGLLSGESHMVVKMLSM